MLKIENVDVYGWEAAIRGMRNPKNSWDMSDSDWDFVEDPAIINHNDSVKFIMGENDLKLAKTLANAGTDHGKFLRFITVACDVTAPLYWWKEADQYKVGTVTDSCSTMHKIHAKEFTLDDFSHEHLNVMSRDYLLCVIFWMNKERLEFIKTKDKKLWWQMIQLLPTSYNQKRTWLLNYQVLQNIYHARKNHKLDEWHTLCDWIKSLPYNELITGEVLYE